jgi:hypothetical protein
LNEISQPRLTLIARISACGDHRSFFVIDPNGLTMFPADWHKTDCNAARASKRIGSRSPFEIDAQ